MHRPLASLNGMRFLAALAVVTFHYGPQTIGYERLPVFLKNVNNRGPAAVGFFFLLSGFVLSYRYLTESDQVHKKTFYLSRFARLYPAYLLAFVLFIPIALTKCRRTEVGWLRIAAIALVSILMVQAWTSVAQGWNGPSWSLSVEAFMYLIFPFAGRRLMQLDRGWTVSVTAFCWLFPAILAGLFCGGIISEHCWSTYFRNNPLLWTPLFLAGICSWNIFEYLHQLRTPSVQVLSAIAVLAFLVSLLCWPGKWNEVFITGGITPIVALITTSLASSPSWWNRWLSRPVLDRLGRASYTLYIFQSPFWHFWQSGINRLKSQPYQTMVSPWEFGVFVVLLSLISLVIHQAVEEPARRLVLNRIQSLGEVRFD